MDQTEIIDKLTRYKSVLSSYIKLKKMYLFGSFSQNRNRDDSDIDVAIVVDEIRGDYFKYMGLIWKLGGDIDPRIEPVVFTENQPDPSGFFDTIQSTGIEIN